MSKHKIITLTGGDCIGKETQTKLLASVLSPSERMSAPNYDHWSGKIARSILIDRPFVIQRNEPSATGNDQCCDSWHKQDKHPEIFQMLMSINIASKQDRIRQGLEDHHWVMDRYIEDAYSFGLMDGCSLDFLLGLNRDFIQSDVVIVMLGKGFPRPGEVQDINERDDSFQAGARDNFRALSRIFPHWHILEVDQYRSVSKIESIKDIHNSICALTSQAIGKHIRPMGMSQISECLEQWAKPTQIQSETSS